MSEGRQEHLAAIGGRLSREQAMRNLLGTGKQKPEEILGITSTKAARSETTVNDEQVKRLQEGIDKTFLDLMSNAPDYTSNPGYGEALEDGLTTEETVKDFRWRRHMTENGDITYRARGGQARDEELFMLNIFAQEDDKTEVDFELMPDGSFELFIDYVKEDDKTRRAHQYRSKGQGIEGMTVEDYAIVESYLNDYKDLYMKPQNPQGE